MGGGKDSESQDVTQTQTSQPWSAQIPYLQKQFQRAEQNYQTPLKYIPTQYAPFSTDELTSQNMIRNAVTNPAAYWTNAQDELAKTLSGSYLSPDSNQYLQSTVEAALRPITENYTQSILPSQVSSAQSAGRYGSGAYGALQSQLAQDYMTSLGETSSKMYSQNYENERSKMLQALGLSPTYQTQELTNLAALDTSGAKQRTYEQALLDEITKGKQFAQTEPWQRLQLYQNAIAGNYGGTSTTTGQVYGPSTLQQGLGTGLSLAGMYNLMGGSEGIASLFS